MGYVTWRVLPDPDELGRDLFDAGRIIPPGYRESFRATLPPAGGRIVVRTVATRKAKVRVLVEGNDVGALEIEPADTWTEPSLALPSGLPTEAKIDLVAEEGEWIDHHVWIVATR